MPTWPRRWWPTAFSRLTTRPRGGRPRAYHPIVPKKSRDRAEWERTKYAEATTRVPERAKFETTYGASLPPIFDAEGADPGLPGEPPFTRGVQPTMYRGRLWTMRQYAGFGTAEESNARYRYLREHGQTGLSVAFDLPTQMGYDADDPRVAGEVGKVGVSISSLDDFARLFDGIPIGEVTTSMTINATAAILLAMYVAVAKRQGVAADCVGGTTQNDILKEYIARGPYIFPPRPSMRLATDLIASCAQQPQNNIVRTAIEALAAVLGGTQSLHTNAYDEALGLPTEDSVRIALRTQQIIAEESDVAETIDPLGGAHAIEALTADIERRTLAEIAKIDHEGGALAGIERGYQQRAIEDSAYKQQRAIESKEKVIVGVNAYRAESEGPDIPITRVDPAVLERQRERLADLRRRRDAGRATKAREDLEAAARGTANLVPFILGAVEADVTLGEICTDLRGVFGTYVPPRL